MHYANGKKVNELVMNDYLEIVSLYDVPNFENKFRTIMESDLSILKLIVNTIGEQFPIQVRSNNIFYCHNYWIHNRDYAVRLNENEKTFNNFATGESGTIIRLLAILLHVDIAEALNILYAYVVNEPESLLPELRYKYETVCLIFRHNAAIIYRYLEMSQEKTDLLNQRIDDYVNQYGDSDAIIDRMSRRLCCSKKYILSYQNSKLK